MSMIFSEEQQLLADTASEFLRDRSPVAVQRKLRDEGVALGFDEALWREIVAMGWSAIPFPESLGGLEFGCKGLGAVFEQIGANVSATPLLSSIVLAGSLFELAASAAQQEAWLAPLISGEKRLAVAIDEGPRHDPAATALQAEAVEGGYVLTGSKVFVVDAIGADGYIVVARSSGTAGEAAGLSLFLVPANTAGLSVQPLQMIDVRNHGNLHLDGVRVDGSALIGEAGRAAAALDQALDRARACLAAELLGASQALFDTTIEYLKTRIQFDVPIGSFQALQHRAAWCFAQLELARSAVMAGLGVHDEAGVDADTRARMVSLAKWKAGEVAHQISREAVQMHGGMGVTDELDVGFYLKRIRVAQACLGDADFHVDRYGRLSAGQG